MNKLLEKVYECVTTYKMFDNKAGVVIGLSGGADSVCLLCALDMLAEPLGLSKNKLVAVHVNHLIRGEEASADEEFSKNLCERLGIKFVSYRKDIVAYAREKGMSVEEAGRHFRYECFEEQRRVLGFDKIAVAHNRNDVAETVLFNMVRGSGIKGMSGIPAVRDNIVRPLIEVTRAEIESFLEKLGQDYRIDRTNLTLDYDRNKIRHIVLPAMLELNDKAIEHICLMANDAKDIFSYVDEAAKQRLEACKVKEECKELQIVIDAHKLLLEERLIRQHILYEAFAKVAGAKKDITRRHIEVVDALLYKGTGKKIMLPYDVIVENNYGTIIFRKNQISNETYNLNITDDSDYIIPEWGRLKIKIEPMQENLDIPKKMYTIVADYGKIKDTICVRTPEENDYIIIDNKGNKKKLSRLFIDNKVDRNIRENWPVVACGSEIIWAIGLRYSENFRIDDNTKEVIWFEYTGKGEEYVRKNRSVD